MTLDLRIESTGPRSERGVAVLCSGGVLRRDLEAPLGTPAATGTPADGAEALALLVQAAELSLDDTDLRITLHRR